jgi:hypothetical protein
MCNQREIFEEQAADGGLVRNGLTGNFDGVVGDGGLFLGRGCGGFGRFFSRLGVFFLRKRICGSEYKKRSCGTQQGQAG